MDHRCPAAGGEPDRRAGAAGLAGLGGQDEVVEDAYGVVGRGAFAGRAAGQSAQPQDDLLQGEGLGDVVVGARFEAVEAVLGGVAGGARRRRGR
ncbi:hypothetical protein [Streptomyces graminifolii]|uniref:hypothetical protein n=1 Tax=Streptomyces graminifolii TaxID=1266771 RepID=UPI0040599383